MREVGEAHAYLENVREKLKSEREELSQTFELERKSLEDQLNILKTRNREYWNQLNSMKQEHEISEMRNRQRVGDLEQLFRKAHAIDTSLDMRQ